MENKIKWYQTPGGTMLVAIVFFCAGAASMQIYTDARVTPSTPSTFDFQLSTTSPSPIHDGLYRVVKVIDGDTIEIEGGQRVRYIGIDTPETVDPRKPVQCFGRQASAKNRELVEGKEVRLEKDISETDQYRRLLRYVWVGDVLVNDYLVRQGYARASSYPPDVRYQKRFTHAQQEASDNSRGLWGAACASSPVTAARPTAQVSARSCQYACSGPDRDCADFSSTAEAQTFFNCCGFSAINDPMRLDHATEPGNGLVCESLP